MIRHMTEQQSEKIVINIWLKDGTTILGKDTISNCTGPNGNGIHVWLNETTLRFYPMDQIECFEYQIIED